MADKNTWWQVGFEIKVEPGLNGKTVEVIVDVNAPENDRYKAVSEALAALVHRTDVKFAIKGRDISQDELLRRADGQV